MEFASDADRAYANAAFIPGGEGYYALWQDRAARFRAAHPPRDIAYGPGPRQRLDLWQGEGGASHGLLVIVHGGYWMATGREDWSHLAEGAIRRGWAVAIPSYTLAPGARIAAMTAEIAAAVRLAADRVAGPVVVTGHSAGGQLAARMACTDQAGPVARVVPVSPLSDLGPLMATGMNGTLHLDEDEVSSESPALLPRRPDVAAHVWVGGQERPAFLWQARTLSEAWDCPWTVAPGRHHFDVIDDYTTPDSLLMAACLDGL